MNNSTACARHALDKHGCYKPCSSYPPKVCVRREHARASACWHQARLARPRMNTADRGHVQATHRKCMYAVNTPARAPVGTGPDLPACARPLHVNTADGGRVRATHPKYVYAVNTPARAPVRTGPDLPACARPLRMNTANGGHVQATHPEYVYAVNTPARALVHPCSPLSMRDSLQTRRPRDPDDTRIDSTAEPYMRAAQTKRLVAVGTFFIFPIQNRDPKIILVALSAGWGGDLPGQFPGLVRRVGARKSLCLADAKTWF